MPDLPLEDFRRDVISHIDVPDFDEIVRRDQRNRRRRRVVIASVVASVIVSSAVAFGNTGEPRSLAPAKPDSPEIKSEDASGLLATLTGDEAPSYTVNPEGDLLASWRFWGVSGPDACAVQQAFTWRSADGTTRDWVDPVGHRAVLPLLDGFIVGGGQSGPCAAGRPGQSLDDEVYFVDEQGRRLKVDGLTGPDDSCALRIQSPACRFSLADRRLTRRETATGLPGRVDPDGTHWYVDSKGNINWARPGEPYRSQAAQARGAYFKANGAVAFHFEGDGAFFRTIDHGDHWSTVDIGEAAVDVGCESDPEFWASTASGTFAAVCESSEGRQDRLLIRSTDASWTEFQAVELDATMGVASVDSVGNILFAETRAGDGLWISKDQGVSWGFVAWNSLR